MKMKITTTVFVLMLVLTACQKNDIFDSAQKAEISSYEAQLTQDYTQASLYHSALMPSTSTTSTTTTTGTTTTTTGSDGTDHASHHVIGLSKVSSVDIDFNKLM